MAPTDRVRRIWFRDEAIWHVREEAWGAERGSQGTVRDVSVFDFEGDGLKPASYRLQLYVNDVFQGEAGFGITP